MLCCRQTGKPAEALAAYSKALAILQKLADANPAVTEFQSDLAESHHNIGRMLCRMGKPAEALAAYQQGAGHPAEAGRRQPRLSPTIQSDLAGATQHRLVRDGEAGTRRWWRSGRHCHPAEAGRRQPRRRHLSESLGLEPQLHRPTAVAVGEAGGGAGSVPEGTRHLSEAGRRQPHGY